jgi:hypothetical protein
VSQLIYAVRGVMVIQTASGQWVVPPTRALWMPASVTHWIRMVGHVRMRTVYVQPRSASGLPAACAVVAVSPLLSALILETVNVRLPYTQDSRDGRVMGLLIDEIVQMPALPLNLPYPSDPRLRVIQVQLPSPRCSIDNSASHPRHILKRLVRPDHAVLRKHSNALFHCGGVPPPILSVVQPPPQI